MGDYAPPKIVGAHRDWLVERTAAFTLRGLVTECKREADTLASEFK
jgi:hypothetical protein